jgi:Tfp pilus assembly protein FimT
VTVVFPRFSGGLLAQQRLRSSVNKISSVAEYAHQRAVSTHLIHRLVINIEHGTYNVTAHKADGQLVTISDDLSLKGRLPENIYFAGIDFQDRKSESGEESSIEFSPEGWIEPVTIYVACLEGRKMGIVMHEMLGSVEILEVLE